MFKPACLLFYLLTILVFFVIGAAISGIAGAAEDQGLAGAAIVIGYGAIFAFLALLISLIIVYRAEYKTVKRINMVFTSLLVLAVIIILFRQVNKKDDNEEIIEPTKQTTAVSFFIKNASASEIIRLNQSLELGFLKPDFFDYPVLYFYGKPNLQKNIYRSFSY